MSHIKRTGDYQESQRSVEHEKMKTAITTFIKM